MIAIILILKSLFSRSFLIPPFLQCTRNILNNLSCLSRIVDHDYKIPSYDAFFSLVLSLVLIYFILVHYSLSIFSTTILFDFFPFSIYFYQIPLSLLLLNLLVLTLTSHCCYIWIF